MSDSTITSQMTQTPSQSPDGKPAASLAENAPERLLGEHEVVFSAKNVDFYYGKSRALRDVTLDIRRHEITALIGPSGCGKSTFLRCLNRMNDLIPGARVTC